MTSVKTNLREIRDLRRRTDRRLDAVEAALTPPIDHIITSSVEDTLEILPGTTYLQRCPVIEDGVCIVIRDGAEMLVL